MSGTTGINIYIADEINSEAAELLESKGFNVIQCTGLDNNNLLKLLSSKSSTSQKNSTLVIRSTRKLDKVMLEKINRQTDIKLICTVSTGFDNIDLAACKKYQISILNVPGANHISAGEFTVALILAISKNIMAADRSMKTGIFDNRKILNFELHGKTIGIIGVGRIGSYVAKVAKAMGMKIVGNDINNRLKAKYSWIKFTELDTLLRSSDIVTVHTPLDESTRHLINTDNISLMQKHAILINCARGSIIEEKALLEALTGNKIFYAGVDVFETEPGFNVLFTKLKNVILTPHVAGKTVESRERMSLQAAENIVKFYTKTKNKI